MCDSLNNLKAVLRAEPVVWTDKKKCFRCKSEKDLDYFHKDKKYPDGLSTWCKECACSYKKERKNGTKIRVPDFEVDGILSRKCKTCSQIKSLEKFTPNKNCLNGRERKCIKCTYQQAKKAGRTKRTDKIREREKARKKRLGKEFRDKENAWRNNYYKNNPQYKLSVCLRNRIKDALKRKKTYKASETFELLGATAEEVRKHIESLWLPGMNWENYGFGDDKWHVDHIIPVTAHDLTIKEEQYRCFNYRNLQPLWQKDNLQKYNKILKNET
jgi:hypothetical protein